MKKVNKKKLYPFIVIVCIILILLIVTFVLSDKNLDLESDQVNTLYKYLGEVDIYHCGGLAVYTNKTITKNDLSKENTLCMAYYNLEKAKISEDTIKSSGINENDIKICKVGESTTLATNDNEDICTYETFNIDDLNASYKKIYGEDIKNYQKFYISSSTACFPEGDKYYCGTSENFTYSLMPEATIYRLLNKAVKKINGDIVIYDYFLKISDNKCYQTNSNSDEEKDCSSELEKQNDIDIDFVKKYGSIYKHTFKKDSNNNYNWFKSELK